MPPAMNFHFRRSSPTSSARSAEVDALRAENAEQAKKLQALEAQLETLGGLQAAQPVDSGTDMSPEARRNASGQLRKKLMEAQRHVGKAQVALNRLLVAAPATSRAGHLRALPELIGPPPNDRTWQDEWVKLKAESYRLSGQGEETVEEDEAYVREHDPIDKYIQQEGVAADIQHLVVDQGWPPERAQVYTLLFSCVDALGRALSQREPCYAASTYALCEALFAQRQGAEDDADVAKRRMQMTPRRPDAEGRRRSALPQPMYAHLHGLFSLAERDPAWKSLEIPDGTGFRGLTSSALVHASSDPRLFTVWPRPHSAHDHRGVLFTPCCLGASDMAGCPPNMPLIRGVHSWRCAAGGRLLRHHDQRRGQHLARAPGL